ncbi:MAG: hypothetical protein HY428_00720 [Candidatus Levybacteria bacterium]|nr:hypothetical protein [Candidatus Levybacteria bacterium]
MDFKNVLTPRGFLSLGGVVLVLVGVLGYVGIIGPTPDQSLFGTFWWFDNAENFAHTVLGVVALLAVYMVKDAGIHKFLALAVGALALVVGLYNLMGEVMVLGANLESPADTVLHLVVGVWGLWAGLKGKA